MHEVKVKSILSAKNGMNLYRGCTHGCIYCDSRSTCYHINHEFEDIEVKVNAVTLLEKALKSKRNKCMIGTGSMCDPYLHLENERKLTRKCLELIDYYGFGVSVLTKSDLVLRDLDLLKRINKKTKCIVQMTMTTYEEELCKILEPNVCTTKRRAEVLDILKEEGIKTIVWMTPILPYINDRKDNIQGILDYCIHAKVYGIITFGMGVTLRDGDRQYFYQKLDESFPGIKRRYIQEFGDAYELVSRNNPQLMRLLQTECRKNQIQCNANKLFEYINTFEEQNTSKQMSIFDYM
ncbi:MAG: radical SAM protein [Velocimicrobium sp.]